MQLAMPQRLLAAVLTLTPTLSLSLILTVWHAAECTGRTRRFCFLGLLWLRWQRARRLSSSPSGMCIRAHAYMRACVHMRARARARAHVYVCVGLATIFPQPPGVR